MTANLINALLFQITWFACVLGGAAGEPLWGAAAVLVLAGLATRSTGFRREATFAACLGLVGWLLDTVWIHVGVLDYGGRETAPSWIAIMWVAVGFTVNHSLGMFRGHPALGGLAGAAAAPLCYLSGRALGAVSVPAPLALAAISAAWSMLFWAVFSLSRPNRVPA